MRITLIDLHNALAKTFKKYMSDHPTDILVDVLSNTSVEDITIVPGMAFVSPANSLGFMDGGIDAIYMKMFQGIEPAVKTAIAKNGDATFIGRPFLPIGKALVVPTVTDDVYLVSAPTMFLPVDVSNTHNAYHATYAAIKASKTHGSINHIIIPGMGTGIGKIPLAKAAKQMINAIQDALSDVQPKYAIDTIVKEQPITYAYKEYFETYGLSYEKLLYA